MKNPDAFALPAAEVLTDAPAYMSCGSSNMDARLILVTGSIHVITFSGSAGEVITSIKFGAADKSSEARLRDIDRSSLNQAKEGSSKRGQAK